MKLYLPRQTGWRLSKKASTPSWASAEVHKRANTSLLQANLCLKGMSII
jgi:hypothetical protein